MRFLHSMTLEFREFPNHKEVTYAILSHTWGSDEVLFQELDGLNAETTPQATKQKSGYKKIQACCAQAASDGFEYAWIDTCCIDKRSSAELSEAINSMYRWYQDSATCYAYLADVSNDVDAEMQKRKFRESRWFRRGWTLQELIAPATLKFYGDQWCSRGQEASLGTQRSLKNEISQITRIPVTVLQGSGLSSYSVAQKMSWAAGRETTRIEDRAYCLMGLFEINMPLLYGEGQRAFRRLQEEIIRVSTDETLFAWRIPQRQTLSIDEGVLATSPDDFTNSASIVRHTSLFGSMYHKKPFVVTNMGLRWEVILGKASDFPDTIREDGVPATPYSPDKGTVYVAVLNCHDKNTRSLIGVLLACIDKEPSKGRFSRIASQPSGGLVSIDPNTYRPLDQNRTTIFAALTRSPGHPFMRRIKSRYPSESL